MPSSFLQPGAACEQSRLPGWARLTIAFGVLFGLKYALPLLGVAAVLQLLILLAVATLLAWRFWWNCSPDRRGVLLFVGALWAAGLLKLLGA